MKYIILITHNGNIPNNKVKEMVLSNKIFLNRGEADDAVQVQKDNDNKFLETGYDYHIIPVA